MSEIKLNEYFLPELDDSTAYDRPFFSVDLSTDNELLEYISVNRGLYSGYQGILDHAYDWDISGTRLPYNIVMMSLRDLDDYLSVPDEYNLIEDTALIVNEILSSPDLIKGLENLQMVYQECDAEGDAIDSYLPITGLQAINALRQRVQILRTTGIDLPANVLSCALGSDKGSLGLVILSHYIDNSDRGHPPLSIDMEFLSETGSNRRLGEDIDDALISPAVPEPAVADNLILTVYSHLLEAQHDPICRLAINSSDWARELLRKFKHPKYKLKKGCSTAEKHLGVFALLTAAILGKPSSAVQKYLTGDKYNQLTDVERLNIISDIKPLIEAISAEV